MAVADAAGFPLALHVASASPHEVILVEDTLDRTFTNELPGRLFGDKAYDSDKRLVVTYQFHAENFLAMAQLGCIMILLRLSMR